MAKWSKRYKLTSVVNAYPLLRLPAVFCLALAVTSAPAQTFSGMIEGIVKDSSGAVIPGVKVTITDINTGAVTAALTNGSGNYLASFLNPSKYSAKAQYGIAGIDIPQRFSAAFVYFRSVLGGGSPKGFLR
jgi:hypothetical protein